MAPTHLNQGLYFAKPFESNLALFRRLMTANPGIPLPILKKELAQEGFSPHELPSRFQPLTDSKPYSSVLKRNTHHEKQCPLCAESLYHTDLYDLPWITECLLHGLKLSRLCHLCGRAWPKVADLAERDCGGCGIPPVKVLAELHFPHPPSAFRILGYLYALLATRDEEACEFEDMYHLDVIGTPNLWLKKASIDSKLFAGMRAKRSPELFDVLKPVGIESKGISAKKARLMPLPAPSARHTLFDEKTFHAIQAHNYSRLRCHYVVMVKIALWIARRTDAEHRSHLLHHPNLSYDFLQSGPPYCVFCIAFSVWFCDTATASYALAYWTPTYQHPFFSDFLGDNFLDTPHMYLRHEQEYFTLEAPFSQWLYQRGLEVAFIHTFNYAKEHGNKGKLSQPCFEYSHGNSFPARIGREYLASVEGQTLTFYYEQESLLGDINIGHSKQTGSDCDFFFKFIRKNLSRRGHASAFDFIVDQNTLSFEKFLFLFKELRKQLPAPTGRDRRWTKHWSHTVNSALP